MECMVYYVHVHVYVHFWNCVHMWVHNFFLILHLKCNVQVFHMYMCM